MHWSIQDQPIFMSAYIWWWKAIIKRLESSDGPLIPGRHALYPIFNYVPTQQQQKKKRNKGKRVIIRTDSLQAKKANMRTENINLQFCRVSKKLLCVRVHTNTHGQQQKCVYFFLLIFALSLCVHFVIHFIHRYPFLSSGMRTIRGFRTVHATR